MTPHHEALARLLWHAEQRGEPVEPLSATFPELALWDAYRVQAIGRQLRTAEGEELRGWKVGLTSAAMQEMMGVDQPDGGYLLESMVVSSGAQLRAERFIQPRVEAEIAFLLKSGAAGSRRHARGGARGDAGVRAGARADRLAASRTGASGSSTRSPTTPPPGWP